jgi:predicted ABC-type ATPase
MSHVFLKNQQGESAELYADELAAEINFSQDTAYTADQIKSADLTSDGLQITTEDGQEWLFESPISDPSECRLIAS